jgi:hypothetical protein
MAPPLPTGDADNVQTENPITITPAAAYTHSPTNGAKMTATAPAPKSSANSTAMLATTTWAVRRIVKMMRCNAPPLGGGASSASSDSQGSAFQRGWVGGRSEPRS